jgi:hypothetical protein
MCYSDLLMSYDHVPKLADIKLSLASEVALALAKQKLLGFGYRKLLLTDSIVFLLVICKASLEVDFLHPGNNSLDDWRFSVMRDFGDAELHENVMHRLNSIQTVFTKFSRNTSQVIDWRGDMHVR